MRISDLSSAGCSSDLLSTPPAPATHRLLQRAMKTFSQGARVWPRPAIRAQPATNQRGTGMTTDTGRRNVIKLLGAGALGLGVGGVHAQAKPGAGDRKSTGRNCSH